MLVPAVAVVWMPASVCVEDEVIDWNSDSLRIMDMLADAPWKRKVVFVAMR